MTTSRDRFIDTLEFKPVSKPWVRWGAFLWDETVERWRNEGWDGTPLDDYFELDRLVRVDPWYGPVPEFKHEVISEDANTVTYVNHEGIVMREFKTHHDMSMPQFVKFPVENEAEFEQFAAERLALNEDQRLSTEWKQQVASGRVQVGVGRGELDEADTAAASSGADADEVWPRKCWADRWGGFFGSLRNMLGVRNLCVAFYDQPRLVERMMEERADRIIEITGEVLKHTQFDTFWFWEDMAYKSGPLVGPDLFRKFALPHYQRVCEWLRSQGIRHIGLDSDGNIDALIPLWLEAGINPSLALRSPIRNGRNQSPSPIRQATWHDRRPRQTRPRTRRRRHATRSRSRHAPRRRRRIYPRTRPQRSTRRLLEKLLRLHRISATPPQPSLKRTACVLSC